jgi:Ice-binding-like
MKHYPKRASLLALISVVLLSMALMLFSVTHLSSYAQNSVTRPLLGTASSFAVLGASTVTNTGPSVLNGNLGVSPGSAITGFPPGTVYGSTHKNDGVALQAQKDVKTAYNTIVQQFCPHDMTGQDLGGKTLVSGVYCFSSSAQLTGHLTLSGNGLYIFQIGSTLTTGSNSSVKLESGTGACNVFWQVGSSATVGTDTDFVGNILALTSITANHGATFNGGLYARSGAVTLDTNTVSRSSCGSTPTPTRGTPATRPTKFPKMPSTGSDPNP